MPIHRTIKNVVKNYTPAEVKVREATSNDPWGPTTTLMNEIAEMTYDSVLLSEVMNMIWKRMSDQGKNWRHVFKSLNLLEYLAKVGSPTVADRSKSQLHHIQGLSDFIYYEDGKDCGACIREKSRQFVSLLRDTERFKNERVKAITAKERLAQSSGMSTAKKMSHSSSDRYLFTAGRAATTTAAAGAQPLSSEIEAARPSSHGEEDLQLQLAIAMSKEEHEEELKRRKGDEIKLQIALEESKKISEEFQKTIHSLDQDLLRQNTPNKISSPPGKSTLPTSSTWDGNLSQPLPSSSMDPWGGPTPLISPPQRPHNTSRVADPWGDSFAPKEAPVVQPVAACDPWSPVAQQPAFGASPWDQILPAGATANESSQHQGFNPSENASERLDSEFDLLSIRTTKQDVSGGLLMNPISTLATNPNDYLGGLGEDLLAGTLWGSQSKEETSKSAGKKMKSVEDFLGSNSNLVNLNDLITKPPPSTIANPFAMTTNPANQMISQPAAPPAWPPAIAQAQPAFPTNQMQPFVQSQSYPQHNNPFL